MHEAAFFSLASGNLLALLPKKLGIIYPKIIWSLRKLDTGKLALPQKERNISNECQTSYSVSTPFSSATRVQINCMTSSSLFCTENHAREPALALKFPE